MLMAFSLKLLELFLITVRYIADANRWEKNTLEPVQVIHSMSHVNHSKHAFQNASWTFGKKPITVCENLIIEAYSPAVTKTYR